VFASKARSGLTPLRPGFGGLRSLRRHWEGSAFALPREGMVLFASKARSGPFPLPPAWGRVGWLLGQRSFGERFLGSWGLAGLG
jgi:hypothetical protein